RAEGGDRYRRRRSPIRRELLERVPRFRIPEVHRVDSGERDPTRRDQERGIGTELQPERLELFGDLVQRLTRGGVPELGRIRRAAGYDRLAVGADRQGVDDRIGSLGAGELAAAELVEVAPLPAPRPLGALPEQLLDATDVARRPLALGQGDLVEIEVGLGFL